MRCKKTKSFIFLIVILFSIQFVFSQTIKDSDSTHIDIIGSGIRCDIEGIYGPEYEYWIDYNFEQNEAGFRTEAFDSCYNSNAIGTKTCCQIGISLNFAYECNSENKCEPTGQTLCDQYGTDKTMSPEDRKDHCTRNSHLAVNSFDEGTCGEQYDTYKNGCYDVINCECTWDSESSTCSATSSNGDPICIDGNGGNGNVNGGTQGDGSCNMKLDKTIDLCDSQNEKNEIILKYKAEIIGSYSGACEDRIDKLPCESIVKLEFFTPLNIILTIIVLILIYIFYPKFKQKSKQKNVKNKK